MLALALVLGVVLPAVPLARAEEATAAAPADATTEPAEEEEDDTKKLLKQLTISLVEDVVDERTIAIRNHGKPGSPRIFLRLGNTATPEGASPEKIEATKAYLSKLVAKQMIHYKAAAEMYQPAPVEDGEAPMMVADVWVVGGKHVNSLLTKEGHLTHIEEYKEELARDILSAEAEETKKQSYKELEEALKESEAAKAKERAEKAAAEKAAEKAEREKGEPIGLGGYMGLAVVLVIVVGVATNFGRPADKKRVNLNKKRGLLGKLWLKLKGHAA
jgi:endonuclease YncB( thermonuclease family)